MEKKLQTTSTVFETIEANEVEIEELKKPLASLKSKVNILRQ